MGGEWRRTTIGDLCDAGVAELQTGPFGSQLHAHDYVDDGVPVVPTEAIRARRIDHSVLPKVSPSKAHELSRHRLLRGDILFARRGVQATGHIGCVRDAEQGFLCGTGAIRLRVRSDSGDVDSDFLSHVLADPASIDWFKFHAIGATMPNLNEGIIRSFPLLLPPPSEQRAIAHILGTLDDKIELNRRMSETLEAMARALFQSWFVDFLPVRAKMAANANDPSLLLPQVEPGSWYVYAIECNDGSLYIGQTEDLRQRWLQHVGGKGANWTKSHPPARVAYWEKQPSREAAVERENWLKTGYGRKWLKKEIAARTQTGDPVRAKCRGDQPVAPTGWQWPQHILDLFPDRLVPSELGEIPEGWEVKPISELAEVVGGSTPKTERAEYWEGGTHHWVTPKDLSGLSMPVLLDTERKITDAGLGQISSGLLPKGTVLLSSRAPIGYLAIAEVPVAVNQGFIAMKPRPGVSNLFLLRWAGAAHDEIVSRANGSTFLEISKASFRSISTVTPAADIMDAFDRVTRPMYLKVVEHERESRTLAALRDTLLPKLISGELRVKDAEAFLKERGL
jgi:restriction endonuclease S subunit/predicted GIY-YIG superfamily endonuclease